MTRVTNRPVQGAKLRRDKPQASARTRQSQLYPPSKNYPAVEVEGRPPIGRYALKSGKLHKLGKKEVTTIVYTSDVDEFARRLTAATPMEVVEVERAGVLGSFIKDLSKRMEITNSRMFSIIGVPKATVEKKAASGEMVSGSGGQAAIGMVKLLGIAQDIVANSTLTEAKGFDAAKWLGQWIERPQPSLNGRRPADLLDTRTGVEVVARLLGSIESGAHQ